MKSKAKISVQNKIFQFDIACIEVYVNTPFFHSLCQVSLGPMHNLSVVIKKLGTTHPPKRLCHYGKCVHSFFFIEIRKRPN